MEPRSRSILYFVAVVIGGIVAHQAIVGDVVGSGGAGFLRRNSEAYALMALVPAYWELFARSGDPRRIEESRGRRHPQAVAQGAWFMVLAAAVVVLQSDVAELLDLAESIVTLGEAFVAALVISLYLGWSRGFAPWDDGWTLGSPAVPIRSRLAYYGAVIVFTFLVHRAWVSDLLGAELGGALDRNDEAYAAALVIPLYFDLARYRRLGARLAWYGGLVAAPLVIQAGVLDPLLGGALIGWLERTTEAFIAAIAISLYFDYVRGDRSLDPTTRRHGESAARH